jgi:hypothetical protein
MELTLAKRPKPGVCVHCLQEGERNWDHVFPSSWYPDPSRANEARWKIPSCIRCNSAYGRLEEDFLRRVALCLDPNNPASQGVIARAMRGMEPLSAKSPNDANARATVRQRILADIMKDEEIPREATYPGMGERWGRPIDEQVAIAIPTEYVQRMVEKIVRGLFYIEDKRLIEPEFEIEHLPVHEEPARALRDALDRYGKTHARPPGLIVRRAVAEDDVSSIFEILLWGQFRAFATVTRSSGP